MASFADISTVRLKISDPVSPPGIIAFVNAATEEDRPEVADAASQTAYRIEETMVYSQVLSSAFANLRLRVSDVQIGAWIDVVGVDGAAQNACRIILAQLGQEMLIAKNADGDESTEFTSLKDLADFYRRLVKDLAVEAPLNVGRMVRTKRPCIAGNNL